MGLISRFLERRERRIQEKIEKTLVARLTELGVQVLNAPPENPPEVHITYPDIMGHAMSREGAENNFLEEVQYRKVQSLHDLRYEYSSVGTAVWARVYQ